MAAAVADAAAASRQPPGPGPALRWPELAAISGATAAAAAMTHVVHPSADDPIFLLILSSLGCILLHSLLSIVVFVLLLRAALRDSDSILQVLRSTEINTKSISFGNSLFAQILDVLSVVGCFVAMELSMGSGSRACWIGALAIDVGVVISASICCFDILPFTFFKLWRMKPRVSAAHGCVV
ncbi:hypothetical protein HU200_033392 [Digitaria exilis]|uniref:Uncharacterized protein n=1 Tax=Digitaria exilis TaxID=1010633 RepID=A0A835ENQ9_9POAL|nr:hypothetical protein HU200_033392 [Digitaria exilis]